MAHAIEAHHYETQPQTVELRRADGALVKGPVISAAVAVQSSPIRASLKYTPRSRYTPRRAAVSALAAAVCPVVHL